MKDFDALALDWYRQDLDELGPQLDRTADLVSTVVDLAMWIEVAVEHGATLEEIAAVLQLPARDVAPFMPGYDDSQYDPRGE